MLYEDYRPQSFSEFLGNSKAVNIARKVCGKALESSKPLSVWIDGASGTGKTTMAMLMARLLGCNESFGDVVELDGSACTKLAVKDLEDRLQYKTLTGGFRAVIVNEAHAMTDGAVQSWLTLLERLGKRTFIAFTTTEGRKSDMFGSFDSPLKSRCLPISLTNQGLADAFAVRAMEIAEIEELGGANLKSFKRLVQDNKNNMRAVLSAVEAYDMYRDAELIEA